MNPNDKVATKEPICNAAPGFGICTIQDPCPVHNCGPDGTCGCTDDDGNTVPA